MKRYLEHKSIDLVPSTEYIAQICDLSEPEISSAVVYLHSCPGPVSVGVKSGQLHICHVMRCCEGRNAYLLLT